MLVEYHFEHTAHDAGESGKSLIKNRFWRSSSVPSLYTMQPLKLPLLLIAIYVLHKELPALRVASLKYL